MTDLFECDFSRDELAVLADLLELPALPGIEPGLTPSQDAKAAAARGLLARAVLVADSAVGTVEITQPYATMLSLVLHAPYAEAADPPAPGGVHVVYRSAEAEVVVTAADGPLVTWAIRSPQGDLDKPAVTAQQDGTSLTFGSS